MAHRNSDDNDEPHHLYEIVDKTNNDTFKYGISCDPIGKDGLSKRVRVQVNFANLIDHWARFFARILIYDITGRKEAKKLESEHIRACKKKAWTKTQRQPYRLIYLF
jgi:URI fold toxin 2